VEAEVILDTERKREPIRRADIDGDYEPAATMPGCTGVSDGGVSGGHGPTHRLLFTA